MKLFACKFIRIGGLICRKYDVTKVYTQGKDDNWRIFIVHNDCSQTCIEGLTKEEAEKIIDDTFKELK